jgi:hypothetical protein
MNGYEPISGNETPPHGSATTGTKRERWTRIRALLAKKLTWVGAAVVACAVLAVSLAFATSSSTSPAQPVAAGGTPPAARSGATGSNARSGPAAGGSAGTVGTVSTSGFTMTTAAGQKVTVNEASSTTYENGTSPTSASAIATGKSVLVLGTTSGTTITATQVQLEPDGSTATATSTAAGVIAFQQGTPSPSKQTGQIPVNYTEGSGTIVSGTTANRATEAALAAYPGGVVDRVVQLSNGEYEVHYIGVNWPHHIFVAQDFTVAGAD